MCSCFAYTRVKIKKNVCLIKFTISGKNTFEGINSCLTFKPGPFSHFQAWLSQIIYIHMILSVCLFNVLSIKDQGPFILLSWAVCQTPQSDAKITLKLNSIPFSSLIHWTCLNSHSFWMMLLILLVIAKWPQKQKD